MKELKESEWTRGKFGSRWLSNPAVVVTPKPRTGEEARGRVSPQIPHFQKRKRVRLPARVHSSWSVAHKSRGS